MSVDFREYLLLCQVLNFSVRLLVEISVVAPQLQDAEFEASSRHVWKRKKNYFNVRTLVFTINKICRDILGWKIMCSIWVYGNKISLDNLWDRFHDHTCAAKLYENVWGKSKKVAREYIYIFINSLLKSSIVKMAIRREPVV